MLRGVLQKCDIWRTPYPQENLTLLSTPYANIIYLRYEVLQKYHVLKTPCPLGNFTPWSTPRTKYDLWNTPDKRLIFVVWSTPYDKIFLNAWSTP